MFFSNAGNIQNNKKYKKYNLNKIKQNYKFLVDYDDEEKPNKPTYFYNAHNWRKYKTKSQLKQWAERLTRKKPKEEWGDEKQTDIWKTGKSWKKNSKRKKTMVY